MHIHKINSNSEEHQNLLAQNRKDPITGDSILEGEEVVFCAGCKSVFLRETWEYLGNRHCEQKETLIDFPLNYAPILLKASEQLLFYSYLASNNGFTDTIPRIDRSIWNFRGQLTQTNGELKDILNIVGFIVVLGVFATILITKNALFILLLILIFVIIFILKQNLPSSKTNEITTFHKEFNDTVFYISDKKIGFSTSFGTEDYASDFADIQSISLDFSQFTSFSSAFGDCIIEDRNRGQIKFRLNYFEISENDSLLKTLNFLNKKYSIEINIRTNSRKNKQHIETFIKLEQSKINFSLTN
ncbi:hypothetical protein WAF17_02985 [Bernardetia sp. ABR2-2B]|uniref:hypothetical protein n=1 Tax=Bernardetia sp. ABR2-2B TaxID=3127472 RepID=UPI0030CAF699